MSYTGQVFTVGRKSHEISQGLLPNKHDEIPLFALRTYQVFPSFSKKYQITATLPEKRQCMLYVFPVCLFT